MPRGARLVGTLEPDKILDFQGRPALVQIHQAIEFWDGRLREAEQAFNAMT